MTGVNRLGPVGLGKEDAIALAKKRANRAGEAFGVWEHVGDYGHPHGDIPARGGYRTHPLNAPDLPRDWVLIATVDPDGV